MHFTKVKGILSSKNGMNLFRGCTHGCIYCDSRSKCYQINHRFEDVEVKENALLMFILKLKLKRFENGQKIPKQIPTLPNLLLLDPLLRMVKLIDYYSITQHGKKIHLIEIIGNRLVNYLEQITCFKYIAPLM